MAGTSSNDARWQEQSLEQIIAHVVEHHHRPLEQQLPRLTRLMREVRRSHGTKDPPRFEALERTFTAVSDELFEHMRKEEQVLFPMIKQRQGRAAWGPIRLMHREHEEVVAALRRMRELADDFSPPDDADTTWRALWIGLAELDRALREHMRLENEVLFQRALTG